jgi:hypothetical protein
LNTGIEVVIVVNTISNNSFIAFFNGWGNSSKTFWIRGNGTRWLSDWAVI